MNEAALSSDLGHEASWINVRRQRPGQGPSIYIQNKSIQDIHAMQYESYQIPNNLPKLQKIVMHPTGRIPI
jgi:hypothetical protein